ncbi:hypothetical protein [Brucella intermedia]|uniref:hypothetical protein n=1 Tax=Brucella intermedia TaxID=94625 RepID=UPI00178C5E04|nr:hypothetical protein [Brucella intermedia]
MEKSFTGRFNARSIAGNACSFFTHYPAQNRFAFFAGNACSFSAHYPTQNRFSLLLEMLALFLRIIPRKTAPHFCWKCWMKRSETAVGATFVSTFNLSIC